MATMGIKVTTTTEEDEVEILSQEAEVEDPQTSPPTLTLQASMPQTSMHHSLISSNNPNLHLKPSQKGLHAKSVGNKVIMLLTATTEWILLIKAKILLPSLQPWLVPLTFNTLKVQKHGSQILVHQIISQPPPTTSVLKFLTMAKNRSL